jgi:hypothetical protein
MINSKSFNFKNILENYVFYVPKFHGLLISRSLFLHHAAATVAEILTVFQKLSFVSVKS